MTVDERAIHVELAPVVGDLLDRHLRTSKAWYPHEPIPWSQGRDFEPGGTWEPGPDALPEEVRSALFVNLLTEDNLPWYTNELHRVFGGDGPWGEWLRQWTAEEGRHSIAIRDWLVVTRSLDPWALERARMAQVTGARVPEPAGVLRGMVYVTLQELATRISHHNTGKVLGDKPGYEVMKRVAADENYHFLFYRDLTSAALELDPSGVVKAIEREVIDFEMPGTGIIDFQQHASRIARAGIYNFAIHHDHILQPVVMRHWRLEHLEGLDAEAEQARERTIRHIERIERVGRRQQARSEREQAREEGRGTAA